MALSPGTRLGPYEVIALLGVGGMGEVYRATDTNLKRQVAIKVLPAAVAGDPDRLARFQREAEVLAALNHPNIAAVYGLEKTPDLTALVMELVEGEDLSEIIARHGHPAPASVGPSESASRGPAVRGGGSPRAMTIEDALPIVKQVAEALEAAHEQGIIHRDLKPANIKVRADGTVKVLDFGLAKALAPDGTGTTSGADALTLTSPAMTQMGMILGTAAYMAPEQARGKPVDRRADIWAFGVVLYEMLTGRRPFDGEDVSLTLSQVLQREPDFDALPATLSPTVRVYLQRCLHKDPKQRVGDIRDVRLALEGAFETHATGETAQPLAAAPPSVAARALPWAVAAVLGCALGVALWAPWRADGPADRPLVRATLDLPGFAGDGPNLALSPDGTRIAYVERGEDGRRRLATRPLAEREARTLAGTEDATAPFFSPDGQWIAFAADGQVKKVLALGGAPLKVTDAPAFLGGSWADDGFIIATVDVSGETRRIPEAGGAGETLLDPWQEAGAYFPQVLPGGKTVLFGARTPEGPALKMVSLETRQVSTLIPGASAAQYVPTNGENGHLAYRNGTTLLAVPFDPAAGELRGPAIPVLDDVAGPAGVSSAGDLIYPIGAASTGSGWPLLWLRPDGTTETLLEAPARYGSPRISPDGNLLAVTLDEELDLETRLIVYDWRNDRTLTLAEKGQTSGPAVWTPDSRYVIWATPPTDGKRRFLWRRADGSGEARTLVESSTFVEPAAISPDGRYLALHAWGGETNLDVLVAPLDLSTPDEMALGEAEPLVRLPGTEVWPVFSPDGRWVAYFSDESGTYAVHVQRFPGGGGHRKVSEGGSIYPKWSSDGRQLFYTNPSTGRIMAVDYQGTGDAFVASKPREWSPTPVPVGLSDSWDRDPTSARAVVVPAPIAPESAGPPKVAYLMHFFDELRRKAPFRN
jgi:serine/threonine protein kinase/Tol biopolymer transport system component